MQEYEKIVFCDFDGTITVEDTFVKVCRHFAAKELVDDMLRGIFKGTTTLREGIRIIVESIPSARYPEMLDFVNGTPLRPGFDAFLDFLDGAGVPFVVISGGLLGLVHRQLGDRVHRAQAVYAADVDTDGDHLRVIADFAQGSELVNKKAIMDTYRASETVALGDGVTDQGMALAASLVFARRHLADYLDSQQQPYLRWEDFHDVRETLARRWGLS